MTKNVKLIYDLIQKDLKEKGWDNEAIAEGIALTKQCTKQYYLNRACYLGTYALILTISPTFCNSVAETHSPLFSRTFLRKFAQKLRYLQSLQAQLTRFIFI